MFPRREKGQAFAPCFLHTLNTMHAGRKAFIKAEVSERIRRALRHRIRPSGVYFEKGHRVYYKREGKKEWKGPGKVIGRDGKVVILQHGNQTVRAHSSRVVGIGYEFGASEQHAEVQKARCISHAHTLNYYKDLSL